MKAHIHVPRVLSIAGTDPTGGAGIQGDLKSIAANGGFGMAVVTAVVAQNTHGVRSVHLLPREFLATQLDCVSDDVDIDAVKIGMLATSEIVDTVREWLLRIKPPVVVLDPVMIASSGDRLIDDSAEQALRRLLPLADVVTPNIPELAVLAQEAVATDWPSALAQAARVAERHHVIVVAKGGHLAGDYVPDALVSMKGTAVDVTEFSSARIPTTNTHGTGCSLSSALATRFAQSHDWSLALSESKRWLAESILHGADVGVGSGRGPISHFAGLWSRGGIETNPKPEEIEADWWEHISEIRNGIYDLPFIRQLEDGTLNQDIFARYLSQDGFYLREYSRVLAEASRLAPTVEEQSFWANAAHRAITTELQLQGNWIGQDRPPDAQPDTTTTEYIDHLRAVAAQKNYALLIASVLPCLWLYLDIGSRMQHASDPAHPYRPWLDAYGGEGFKATSRRAIDFVTAAVSVEDATARTALRDAFHRSAHLERAFFAAPHRHRLQPNDDLPAKRN